MSGYKPLFIGHRGARGYGAENTLGSFKRALGMGVDLIEFDVHLTRDQIPVVMHDFTVTRTTSGKGRIHELTLAQFKRLRCSNGEHPPTLEETLRFLKGRCGANIEIKTVGASESVACLFARSSLKGILFSSFRWRALEVVRKALPRAKLGVLVERANLARGPFETAQKLGAVSIHPSCEILNPKFMKMARLRGLRTLVYGINGEADLRRCFDLRVDGVFVDYPDKAMAAFTAWKRQAPK